MIELLIFERRDFGMTRIHELKTIDHYFEAVERGEKTFEVRRNDRAFQTGDIVRLVKVAPDKWSNIRYVFDGDDKVTLERKITYILQGGQFGIEPTYCALGLGLVDEND